MVQRGDNKFTGLVQSVPALWCSQRNHPGIESFSFGPRTLEAWNHLLAWLGMTDKSGVADSKLRMICDRGAQPDTPGPTDPCVVVMFCQIKEGGLRDEKPSVDSSLFSRRWITAENGIAFSSPTVKQLARRDCVSRLCRPE